MNNVLYASKKIYDNQNNLIAVVPSKVRKFQTNTNYVNNEKFVEYEVIYTNSDSYKNFKVKSVDYVKNLFNNLDECYRYCQNINQYVWTPFVETCDYPTYKSDIAKINTKLTSINQLLNSNKKIYKTNNGMEF